MGAGGRGPVLEPAGPGSPTRKNAPPRFAWNGTDFRASPGPRAASVRLSPGVPRVSLGCPSGPSSVSTSRADVGSETAFGSRVSFFSSCVHLYKAPAHSQMTPALLRVRAGHLWTAVHPGVLWWLRPGV